MREDVRLALRASLLEGRLSQVFSQLSSERTTSTTHCAHKTSDAPYSKPIEVPQVEAPVPTLRPTKPSFTRTSARPVRHSLRSDATAEHQEQKALQQSPAADGSASPIPPLSPKVSMLPPRPPTKPTSRKIADEKSDSSLLVNAHKLSSPRARLPTLSRPASPVGRLPPVTPPRRRPAPTAPSAMSLDLGGTVASATSLDPGSGYRTKRSSSNLNSAQPPSKHSLSFLPPICGNKAPVAKVLGTRRSASMDSFLWGIAPVVDSHIEWGGDNRLVF